MTRFAPFLAAVPLLGLPLPAFAHVGDHSYAGLWHLLTQADHLPMLSLGVGLVAYALVKFGVRR